MGYWKDQTIKFGILAGMYQLGKAIREEQEQGREEAQNPVEEVQPGRSAQDIDTGRPRGSLLDKFLRDPKLR